jgi:hypothetical protein
MTKLEKTIRQVSDLRDFYFRLKKQQEEKPAEKADANRRKKRARMKCS